MTPDTHKLNRIYVPEPTGTARACCIVMGLVFPFRIVMPCGYEFACASWQDVPKVNTLCPCGNPQHWLVRWEEMPGVALSTAQGLETG